MTDDEHDPLCDAPHCLVGHCGCDTMHCEASLRELHYDEADRQRTLEMEEHGR